MSEAEESVGKEAYLVKVLPDYEDKFWNYVCKLGPLPDQSNPHYAGLGRCWEWMAGKFNRGYGQFRVGKSKFSTQRISWFLHSGSIPDHLFVCHRCDRRSCVNPEHLFLGSSKENTLDAAAKGRMARGERSPRAKLTEAQVRDIRIRYATGGFTQWDLAREHGVRQPVIWRIVNRIIWKHVP